MRQWTSFVGFAVALFGACLPLFAQEKGEPVTFRPYAFEIGEVFETILTRRANGSDGGDGSHVDHESEEVNRYTILESSAGKIDRMRVEVVKRDARVRKRKAVDDERFFDPAGKLKVARWMKAEDTFSGTEFESSFAGGKWTNTLVSRDESEGKVTPEALQLVENFRERGRRGLWEELPRKPVAPGDTWDVPAADLPTIFVSRDAIGRMRGTFLGELDFAGTPAYRLRYDIAVGLGFEDGVKVAAKGTRFLFVARDTGLVMEMRDLIEQKVRFPDGEERMNPKGEVTLRWRKVDP